MQACKREGGSHSGEQQRRQLAVEKKGGRGRGGGGGEWRKGGRDVALQMVPPLKITSKLCCYGPYAQTPFFGVLLCHPSATVCQKFKY